MTRCVVTVSPLGNGKFRHETKCGRRWILPTETPIDRPCRHGLCYCEGPPPPAPALVGSCLADLLASLGLEACVACVLRLMAMDAWGVAGCQANRAQIVGWLRDSYSKTAFDQRCLSVSAAFLSGVGWRLVFRRRPWRVFDSLLDEAIRRAEASTG